MKRWMLIFLMLGIICLPPLLSYAEVDKNLQLPRFSQPPKIDGVLDDLLWEQEALKIEGFRQFSPVEKGQPSEKTVVYIGYDSKNLYVAFRCSDEDPKKLRASITQRDNIMEDDWAFIFLDTFNEKRRAFSFMLNPLGIQMDMLRLEEGGNDNMDPSWDTVFYSDGKIDENGYSVEMAVPFKSFRFPDKEEKVWGITLGRSIARKGEILIWPPASREIPGLLSQGGEIKFRGKVEKGKNFELMPVFTSLKTKEKKIDAQPGFNFKWGISSDITLDMTVNPDFSQIEADAPQIDVNQRFALYYPEKRPFFLEGREIFRFPEIQMVYTRRIIDPIVGAKLTGKVGRYTYGFVSALDTNPTENLWDVSNGEPNKEHNALFNIFRLKADVLKESYVGFSLTDKEINGTYNRVAGIDGQLKLKRNFFFSFQAIASKSRNEQISSDIAPAFYTNIGYYAKYFGGGLFWTSIHPDFEAASGFVNRVDYRTLAAYTYASVYPEKKYLNQVRFNISGGRRFGYDLSTLEDEWLEARSNIRFTELSQLNISFRAEMERFEGVDFQKKSLSLGGNLQLIGWLPFGFSWRIGDSIYYDPDDAFLGSSNALGLYFTLKPNNRLRIGVRFSKETFWENWGGKRLYDYNVVRTRTTYQLSKSFSVRAIFDYNHYYKQIYGSFLISYVLKPGTVFFLGLDNDLLQNYRGNYASESYSIFLKFSYWHRI